VGDGDRELELAEGTERELALALLAVGDGDRERAGRGAPFLLESESIGPGFGSETSHSSFSIFLNSAMVKGLLLHKSL
jgi:hypothetical protein